MAGLWFIGSIDPEPIMEAGAPLRQVDVPCLIGLLLQSNPMGFLRGIRPIEQAKIHRRGIFGEEGEIHPFAVPRGSQRIGSARPYLHRTSFRLRLAAVHRRPIVCAYFSRLTKSSACSSSLARISSINRRVVGSSLPTKAIMSR